MATASVKLASLGSMQHWGLHLVLWRSGWKCGRDYMFRQSSKCYHRLVPGHTVI